MMNRQIKCLLVVVVGVFILVVWTVFQQHTNNKNQDNKKVFQQHRNNKNLSDERFIQQYANHKSRDDAKVFQKAEDYREITEPEKIRLNISKFRELRKRYLRDSDSNIEFKRIISDVTLLRHYSDQLTSYPEEHSKKNENKRIKAVDFIKESITWKNNPIYFDVKESVIKILLDDRFMSLKDNRLITSVAGDRMEIFSLLYNADKETAIKLVSQVQGTSLEKLMNLAYARLDI